MGSVRMPKGKRMACALCFDFDALSLWLGLFRFTTANPLSRGEFGATVAIPRILCPDTLHKYSLMRFARFLIVGTRSQHTACITRHMR